MFPHAATLPRTSRRYSCEIAEGQSLLDRLHVHTGPGHLIVLDPEDDHAADFERRSAPGGAVGAPFAPDRVAVCDGGGDVDLEVGDVADDLGPVRPDVVAARDRRAGVPRPLADVVVTEKGEKGVEIVCVERGAHPFEEQDHSGTLPKAST